MDNESTRREWFFFGALAAVFLVVVLVVAATRPLIFDRIVPEVLGFGAEGASSTQTDQDAAPLPSPSPIPDVSGELPPLSEPTANPILTPGAGPVDAVDLAADPTALPTLRYVVAPGDNLTRIANRFGVTVATLVELNRLDDPDRLSPGTELLIPAP